MGYYTNYILNIHKDYTDIGTPFSTLGKTEEEREIMFKLAEITKGCLFSESEIKSLSNATYPLDILSDDCRKWYDYDEDMIELSKAFPTLWFVLQGEGEDREDNWKAYYHSGSGVITYAETVYPSVPSEIYFDNSLR